MNISHAAVKMLPTKSFKSIADMVKGSRDAISSKVHVAHNGMKHICPGCPP